MIPGMHLLKFVSLGAAEDSPYGLTAPFKDQGGGFKSSWANDMPSFFQNQHSEEGYNVFEDLDTSNQPYFYSTPCDPTEYQNDDIGKVIGMY
eukprot:CAMPEP_0180115982 /NCGR_PEP_ID=MMETSP0986-20121125/103_1 /TAXON_ID=697907 /ORGANISM="non described non described, Strain CCMP2293" /LENGTH=91 /DNA_ID=CAMNT_0022054681 /DNA_START=144 /DNA_END=419 /DNA_ORIENTATION=+